MAVVNRINARELVLAVVLAGTAVAGLVPTAARATSAATMTTDPRNPDVIVGRVQLGAPAGQVWNRVRQVDRWSELFTDIRKLDVRKHEGSLWIVRLDSGILRCGPHDYEIRFTGERAAALKIVAPGIEADGTLSVAAAAGGSLFEYRLRVHVGRIASWFASEKDVRARQWQLIDSYLTDLARVFGAVQNVSR